MYKTTVMILMLSLFPPLAASSLDIRIIDGETEQQAIVGERQRLTVFKGVSVGLNAPIAVFFDSSKLETGGYDHVEWYYLKGTGRDAIAVEHYRYDLLFPGYITENEERDILMVPLSGPHPSQGTFSANGITVRVTMVSDKEWTAEIVIDRP